MLNRRQLLLGSGAALAVGLFSVQSARAEELTRAALTNLLGRFEMPPVDFQRFTLAVARAHGLPSAWKFGFLTYAEKLGIIDDLMRVTPTALFDGYARWRRTVMTDFMLSTEYLQRRDEPLKFESLVIECRSPFADFS